MDLASQSRPASRGKMSIFPLRKQGIWQVKPDFLLVGSASQTLPLHSKLNEAPSPLRGLLRLPAAAYGLTKTEKTPPIIFSITDGVWCNGHAAGSGSAVVSFLSFSAWRRAYSRLYFRLRSSRSCLMLSASISSGVRISGTSKAPMYLRYTSIF